MARRSRGEDKTFKLSILLLCCLFLSSVSGSPVNEAALSAERLYDDLFNGSYTCHILPVLARPQAVRVQFGFNLINIVDVNAKTQSFSVYGWVQQKWNNSLLMWDPEKYGGLKTIYISPAKVWVPDILLHNNVDDQDHTAGGRTTYKTDVILSSNGLNVWNSPALFKSICNIKVDNFPFDSQICTLKFGSWAHDNRTIDIYPIPSIFPTQYYTKNGEWAIYNVSLYRQLMYYECCGYPYADVSLTIKMRRESMDYFINLIIPCCLISSMIFLGFVLPPESGERIGLSITVLLAMTVFQQLTTEIMPAYDFPLLGQYYFAIVLEIGASIVATTMILNFYHRTNRKMPLWMSKLILDWLSRVVLLHDVVIKTRPKRRCISVKDRKEGQQYSNERQSTKTTGLRASVRKKKDQDCNIECSNFDFTYGDNIFSNDHAGDQEIEMLNLSRKNPYRSNNYPFTNSNPQRDGTGGGDDEKGTWGEEEVISEEEQSARHWEWTLAAKILDRFVLCVAVVLGIVTVTAVFLRAPTLWKDYKDLMAESPINITKADDQIDA